MTPSLVRIDPADPTAPSEQVRRQIVTAVTEGRLVPGTRLPPVRTLAAELALAPGTVARAYRELEQAGVVRTQGRAGTTITASGDLLREEAARLSAQFCDRLAALEVTLDDALALVRAAYGRHH